jgi:hypothetical protein
MALPGWQTTENDGLPIGLPHIAPSAQAFSFRRQLSAPGPPPEDRRPICVYLRSSAAHMVFREFGERPPEQPGG